MRQRSQNLLLLAISLTASLIACEIGLRVFTPFPITKRSNKVWDADLGYRLSSKLPDVDNSGFRNTSDGQSILAAIGDSHTYGYNVVSAESWPAALQRSSGIPTYNFGVGSYGVFSYHSLIRQNILGKFKGALIALYPANDFYAGHSYCAISHGSKFWSQETKKLQLSMPRCSGATVYIGGRKIWSYIKESPAIISALKHLVIDRISTDGGNAQKVKMYYEIPSTRETVSLDRARRHMRQMDIQREKVRLIWSDFSRMLFSWSKIARENNLLLGIVIVPTKERLLTEYARQLGGGDISKELEYIVKKEVELEARIIKQARIAGMPVESAIGPLLEAQKKGARLYPPGKGHPNKIGYAAYAEAATKLVRKICDSQADNPICLRTRAARSGTDQ